MDWGPIVQTGIGAAAAIAGGCLGAWLQGQHEQRREQDRRRERAAEAVGPLHLLLIDSNWQRLGLNARHETFEPTFTKLWERWDRDCSSLLVLSTGHPSQRVRELADALTAAISQTLTSTTWYVYDLLGNAVDIETPRRRAERDHRTARELLAQLREAIQGT
jgi:hypothetical protein